MPTFESVFQHSPNMGDQVWFITSKHTEPLLVKERQGENLRGMKTSPYSSSIFGWNILFINPMLGDLNGY
jgi:hypothetical protein